MIEHHFLCPYCNAEISMLLDVSVPNQKYIEDCEVCCNPIELYYSVQENELVEFDAYSIEQ